MIVIATHHKTGHHLMRDIFRLLSTHSGIKYYDVSLMSAVPDDAELVVYEQNKGMLLSYRCSIDSKMVSKGVHIVRHPYEVVVSGYNWHKSIDRKWVNKPMIEGGKSYKENLLQPDGVLYEMRHRAMDTIFDMYHWDYSDGRFLNIRLEDFRERFEDTIRRMALHLGFDPDLLLSLSNRFDICNGIPDYATNRTSEKWLWPKMFTEEHFLAFAEIFPSDVFARLGYD